MGEAFTYMTSTFTDEPSLMTCWMKPMPYLCLPVSDELLAAYEKEAGHPLAEDVPELVCGPARGRTAAVRHRFWSMVGARVAQNYTGQITRWATANGIESGGHLLAEESLDAHVCLYGDFFKVLRGLSAPSCDMLHSVPAQVTWLTPLLVGSAGELNGARHVMSEASDHCQRYRAKGDTRPIYQVSAREIVGSLNRQIWGGVNTFTSYYNWGPFPRAERRAINEEVGRAITLMREGCTAAEIALVYPADSLMVGFEPKTRGGGGAAAQRTAGLVRAAGGTLFASGRSFMFIDAETLEQATVTEGGLAKGNLRWRTVVLPGVSTLPVAAARRLDAFRKAGGLVLALGDRPCNSCTAFPDDEVARLAAAWPLLTDAQAALLPEFLESRHEPALRCVRGPEKTLRIAHRRTREGDVFFVLNDDEESWSGAVRLRDGGAARVWNPRVGLSFSADGDIPLDLPAFGAVVLTTAGAVEGRLVAHASAPFAPMFAPLAEPVQGVALGKGVHVKGGEAPRAEGWRRVDVTLTKTGVDTFAFLARDYARGPFPAGAKGVAFSVRVPETTGGGTRCGVFLGTEDGNQWYAQGRVSLSEKGEAEVAFAFAEFNLHGAKQGRRPARLRAEDVRRISIGFGGYFGREGERVVFEASEPKAYLLTAPKAE
ncbi:MAG: hypothetical protein ACI4RA_10495 [Kiritimatiellia bacterium]